MIALTKPMFTQKYLSQNKHVQQKVLKTRHLTIDFKYKYYNLYFTFQIHHDGKVQYCLDGSDPHYRNWMYFIQYARNQNEQNLMAMQHEERVYFRAMRDIHLGEELLVWYDKHQYDLYMGIPQGFKDTSIGK